MSIREELHQLIDDLPEEKAGELRDYIRQRFPERSLIGSVVRPISEERPRMSQEEFAARLKRLGTDARIGWPPLYDTDISRESIYE